MGGIFLKKSKISFVHIPKTGGQSVRAWMKEQDDFNIMPLNDRHIDVKHPTYAMMKDYFGEDLGYTFAIVRNPYDRIVSMYHHLKKVAPQIVRIDTSFQKFCFSVAEYDAWMKPQSTWFSETDEVDVFKYESLVSDFLKVQNKLDCYKQLPIKNKSVNRSDWQGYYADDEDLRNFVYEKFEEDFIRFGYKK